MSRGQGLGLFLALVPLAWGLMWLGWRRRGRVQSDLPAPRPVAADPAGAGFEGVYVSTTTHGDWLDRVVVHGLGVRSAVTAHVEPEGVALVRQGAPSLFVPKGDLVGAGRTSGMAGKFVEADGLAVVTWVLGPRTVDTGIRLRRATDTQAFVDAVRALVPAGGGTAPAPEEEP